MESSSILAKNSTPANSVDETVTSLTALSLDPGKAAATVFNNNESLYSLWQTNVYLLLEAFGQKTSSKGIHEDYEHTDLDTVAKRGNFPSRPSDLFLKVRL
jgi:hypothetical protein